MALSPSIQSILVFSPISSTKNWSTHQKRNSSEWLNSQTQCAGNSGHIVFRRPRRRLFHEDPDRIKRGVTWLAGSTF